MYNAIPEVLTILDHGAMISVFPKRAAPMLAPVKGTCEVPLELLHHAADSSLVGLKGNLVNVV
jgi:hypothetical protein